MLASPNSYITYMENTPIPYVCPLNEYDKYKMIYELGLVSKGIYMNCNGVPLSINTGICWQSQTVKASTTPKCSYSAIQSLTHPSISSFSSSHFFFVFSYLISYLVHICMCVRNVSQFIHTWLNANKFGIAEKSKLKHKLTN